MQMRIQEGKFVNLNLEKCNSALNYTCDSGTGISSGLSSASVERDTSALGTDELSLSY